MSVDGFVTYENLSNPHVTIHVGGCTQIRKRGGVHIHDQGRYENHHTFRDAEAYAKRTELPTRHCFYCKPQDSVRHLPEVAHH